MWINDSLTTDKYIFLEKRSESQKYIDIPLSSGIFLFVLHPYDDYDASANFAGLYIIGIGNTGVGATEIKKYSEFSSVSSIANGVRINLLSQSNIIVNYMRIK